MTFLKKILQSQINDMLKYFSDVNIILYIAIYVKLNYKMDFKFIF